jgi:hypothetical protein
VGTVEQLSKALEREEEDLQEQFGQKQIKSIKGINKIFGNFLGEISCAALKKAQVKLTQDDHNQCTGFHKNQTGIPCQYSLSKLYSKEQKVAKTHFHRQWHFKVSSFPFPFSNFPLQNKSQEGVGIPPTILISQISCFIN